MAEITIESYCQITIGEMQQQISDYQELIDLANQYEDDLATLAQQESIKRAQFDQEKKVRYSLFGTTAQGYVLYMGKNGNDVKAYFDANPSMKQQIDDLSNQIKALAEEHQAIKEAINLPSGTDTAFAIILKPCISLTSTHEKHKILGFGPLPDLRDEKNQFSF